MNYFKFKPTIHHFKIHFPIPSSQLQSCISQVQSLSYKNAKAIFLSLDGFCRSPQTAQTIHNVFFSLNEKWKIPVYSFLEEQTTALNYISSTCGIVSANPYSLIGDIATTHKTYFNIEKLLKYFNIKIDLLSHQQNHKKPWNWLSAPTQQEKAFSEKWINSVEQNMIKIISKRRKIPIETIQALKSKLMTPAQALSNHLIDHIQTAEQFKETHYSQAKIQNHLFAITNRTPKISGREIQILAEIYEIISMSNVTVLSLQDPLTQCVGGFVEIIKTRIENDEKLQELDFILGGMFSSIESKLVRDFNFLLQFDY